MNRRFLIAAGLLVLVILVFGGIADRAIVDQSRGVERAALAEAEETARLAAFSVRASLAQLELAVVSDRPPPGVAVYRVVMSSSRSLPSSPSRPYRERPTSELLDLVRSSSRITARGLPEAVVAAVALGTVDAKKEAARRLLAGALPVRPDDLGYLAGVLAVQDDPRVDSLAAHLRRAPPPTSLPFVPEFHRSLTDQGTVEGWSQRAAEGIGYALSASELLHLAQVSTRARLADLPSTSPAVADMRTAVVPDVEGLELAVSPDLPVQWPISALRTILWIAVLTSLLGLVLALRAFSQEAAAVSREKAFLSSVTHELRTPLAAMRLFGETLAQGRGDSKEYGALVAQESERLEAQVERVLAVTRMEEAPTFARVRPCEIVTSVLQLMVPRAARREVTIDWQAPDGEDALLEATWDGEAIRQALLNLLENAIKHGRRGGRVEVRASVEDGSMELSVTDDGPGIPRRDQQRIFGRFERGNSESAGTGLGLSLVEQVAHAHGGQVDLVTAEDRGCTFVLSLPLLPPSAGSELEVNGAPAS